MPDDSMVDDRDRGSRPVPDPTELTDKAIAKLKEQIEQEIRSAIGLVSERIAAVADLTRERFEAIERQRIEQKADTKAAVDAALTAQKEAVKEQTAASDKSIAKSEAATTKLLEQQAQTASTQNAGLGGKIDDVKERVARIESIATGSLAQRVEGRSSNAAIYAAIGAATGLVLFVIAIITALSGKV